MDYIKEKGLSVHGVYDRATWRRMSSYIDPQYKWDNMREKKRKKKKRSEIDVRVRLIVLNK